jgi:membrane protein implicated in regulation of membrane protease activity
MSYQLASMLWSGPTALIAATLFAWSGTVYSEALVVIVGALMSLMALALSRETHKKSLTETSANPDRDEQTRDQ